MREFCAQCSLPLSKHVIKARIDSVEKQFCCYGCSLILQITGEKGEEGKSQIILIRLGLGLFFAMYVMLFSIPNYFPGAAIEGFGDTVFGIPQRWLLVLFSAPVLVLLGLPILKRSLHQLSQIAFSVDVLIAIGVFAAYGLSIYNTIRGASHVYFDTATMLLVLVTLGRFLESRGKVKTQEALENLLTKLPQTAVVLRHGEEVSIRTEAIEVGDRVKIFPGDVFPVDGTVESGTGGVDESSLTGESKPVFKEAGQTVSSGTFSVDGTFLVHTKRIASESAAARLAHLLEQAQKSRSPIALAADRIAAVFVPAVVLLAVAVFFYWFLHATPDKALLTALSVLVVSCPCALGIATPIAIWVALGETAKRGILVRDGGALETLARLDTLFFDKTGTLTSGRLSFSKAVFPPDAGFTRAELFEKVAALMNESSHPLARGFLQAHPTTRNLPATFDFKTYAGMGIAGKVATADSQLLYLGSKRFMQKMQQTVDDFFAQAVQERENQGETAVLVAWCGNVRALLSFQEELRPEASGAVAALQQSGLNVEVLSGDSKPLAQILEKNLPGVTFRTNLLPEEKVLAIQKKRRKTGATAMVGDGVNDAPALAAADVGIAVGTGSDLTRETAEINLVSDNLSKIPWLVAFARRVKRRVWGNLFWAFFYNTLAIVIAALGFLNPLVAAVAMILSSFFVIGNSHRLRRAK